MVLLRWHSCYATRREPNKRVQNRLHAWGSGLKLVAVFRYKWALLLGTFSGTT
jgi:hypothetical protein